MKARKKQSKGVKDRLGSTNGYDCVIFAVCIPEPDNKETEQIIIGFCKDSADFLEIPIAAPLETLRIPM